MTGLPSVLVAITFLASGCAALIYQLVWQRYLFTGLGVDIDSVTLIVSTFMLGIGLGGAIGGWLADRFAHHRLRMYAFAELALALFGAISPWVFAGIQSLGASGWPYGGVGVVAMAVVLIPTTIMGTTLPLLTMYFDETLANVGSRSACSTSSIHWARLRAHGWPRMCCSCTGGSMRVRGWQPRSTSVASP